MTLFERTNTFPTLAGMRGISRLHDDIDRLFGGFLAREPWPDFSARDDMALLPQIDFKSDNKTYTMSVELPGFAPEALTI